MSIIGNGIRFGIGIDDATTEETHSGETTITTIEQNPLKGKPQKSIIVLPEAEK